jgi:hypothetical protein
MRTFAIALALASFVSTVPALAADIEFDCTAKTCTYTVTIEKQTTDKFTGACNGKAAAKTSCTPKASYVTCEAGTRDNQCSCTNATDKNGGADVAVGCS